ncbi:hypothetical protein AB0K92_30900 [Streptomyces sp. NPDC052687]|uniref:hypothetical protein n=1 Tax=Streptomyces sp. NPDC052687 TaxID=3154759 RepID=UPI0034376150
MYRGATARTALAALAVVLLAFPCLAAMASFAHAYSKADVAATAQTGIAPSITARSHEEHTYLRTAPSCGDPNGHPHYRDRTRTVAPAPDAAGRPLPARGEPGTDRTALPPGVAYDRERPPTASSQAALQVFRC